ncbi:MULTISPECIES: flagellar filament capping protein FliD [Pseudomonas]|uniref:Flagellar hook-associated protein 2 n=3 Tax=Ectopseudomonas TaxID=3236654 RepID=A0A653B4X3_ECTOL|nr:MULTISPECIES: flagellar filament capping protein FliD [Pseudomonas]CAE6883195.1 Flagellar hook-associated protein 2 [Pseudomonas oleovorans]QFT20122.1 Flagellar hook-associated protein 2 [Pseudomonas sp. THAF187a]QFT40313.1 Flagellar hook-associated protein 2 [Pseudomonas sp. THAF42]QTS86725.1 flagellar filament capping protein FliD [Pseudomonas khazarica]HIQ42705.1 flagellar hook protein FliD [Pseudomonas oleovorans]
MAIDSDYVQSMATQLAQYEIQGQLAKANRNQEAYKAQLNALSSLDTALKSFKSAASGLKLAGSSMLVNSASYSQEGYATATVGSKAVAGSYDFFVQQLASKSQLALQGLQDGDLGSGSLSIGQGSDTFSVDLGAVTTLDELAAAINGAADNSGVKATLVRSNGQVNLVLTSETTGADQAISLTASGNTAFENAVAARQELSVAKDAIVRLGGEAGIELTSSSNTFANIIDGVSLTFSKAHQTGDTPLTIEIAQDQSATKEKAQTFVSAFNALMSSFDSLTASGGESGSRGPLAGDASVRAIEGMLNQLVRTSFGGVSLTEFGIVADRGGKLTIDSARFEKAVAANPEGFEKLFTDKGNLLDTLDKNLAVYTSSAGGLLTNRKDTLNTQLRRVDQQFDNIQKQYDSYYARYLRQYTGLMQTMAAMEQTYGMF